MKGQETYDVTVVSGDRVRRVTVSAATRHRAITGAIRHAEQSDRPEAREYVLLEARKVS